jgi:hypothetical protein
MTFVQRSDMVSLGQEQGSQERVSPEIPDKGRMVLDDSDHLLYPVGRERNGARLECPPPVEENEFPGQRVEVRTGSCGNGSKSGCSTPACDIINANG